MSEIEIKPGTWVKGDNGEFHLVGRLESDRFYYREGGDVILFTFNKRGTYKNTLLSVACHLEPVKQPAFAKHIKVYPGIIDLIKGHDYGCTPDRCGFIDFKKMLIVFGDMKINLGTLTSVFADILNHSKITNVENK